MLGIRVPPGRSVSSRFQPGTQASGALISAQRLCLTPHPHPPRSPAGAQEAPRVTMSTSELRSVSSCLPVLFRLHTEHFPVFPLPFRSSHRQARPCPPLRSTCCLSAKLWGFLIPLRHHLSQGPRHVDPEYAWAPRLSHEIHPPLSSRLLPLPAACTAPRCPLHHPHLCNCSQHGRRGGLLAQSP